VKQQMKQGFLVSMAGYILLMATSMVGGSVAK
jgi:hypothetical protein